MPTITTTVTSAETSGKVTTQTTTEATAGNVAPEVALVNAIFDEWAAGTLVASIPKFYHSNVTVDFGSVFGAKVQGTDLYKKYSGRAGVKTWLELLGATMDFSWFEQSTTAQASGTLISEFNWTATTPVGNEVSSNDMIQFKFADGLVASILFYFSDHQQIVDSFVPAASKAALSTGGYMLSEPEVKKEDLRGKVALVTGASRGIGKHSAIHLAVNCGMKVALAARSTAKLEETVAEIRAKGGEAMVITLDTTKEAQFAPALAQIEQTWGPVQYCFANAGVINNVAQFPHKLKREDMDYCFDTNQKGSLSTFTAVYDHFKKNGGGVFVMNASCGGSMPGACFEQFAGAAIYGASKAALNDLCKSLGALYFNENIRFYNVCPFGFGTDMAEGIAQDLGGGAISVDDVCLINPFFPCKAGPPGDIGPLIEAFFDGDTLYPHGACVEIDHHVTFNTQLKWDRMGHQIDQTKGQALFSVAHLPDEIRDVRGRPLSKEALAEIPSLGETRAFDLGLN